MSTTTPAAVPGSASPPEAAIAIAQRRLTEDWLAVWIGIFIFLLSLVLLLGKDALGWAVTTSVWTVPAKALAPARAASASGWPAAVPVVTE